MEVVTAFAGHADKFGEQIASQQPAREKQIDHHGADDADQDRNQRVGDDVEIQPAKQADIAAPRKDVLEAIQPPQAADEGPAGPRP